jgi:tripartite ATP-independent transporter DctM subunit
MHRLSQVIRMLDKVGVFSRWTNIFGLAALFCMVVVTFIDVFMRYIFSQPIKGVLEITEVMMICAVFLAVAHTQNEKGHISIDVITARLTPKAQVVMEFITNLLGVGIFSIATWRILAQTIFFIQEHRLHSQYIQIPSGPFAAVVFLGCTMLLILLIRDLLRNLTEALRLELTRYHWLLMFGVPILFIILAALWMQPTLWHLSLPVVGLIGVIVSIILFLMGMPVSFALILTSLLFIGHIRGSDTAFSIFGSDLYRTTGSYSWSVLPFFVLMGFFCLFAKFGEDLYYAAYRWLGHVRGGMATATISACTAFAAIVGEPSSATATMGAVALPQMRRYGYDDRLSTGSIVGGASLGPIIPPSVAFIIYGVLTGESIGDLFVAGIIPGLIIAICFILGIYIVCRVNPKMGPRGEKSSWRQRIVSLKAGGPVLALFLLVIGGIYLGIFSPTEGGAIGACVAILLGLFYRRWTWQGFTQSLLGAGKLVSMVFLIIIGAQMFTRFAAWCNLSGVISEFITGLSLSPTGFMVMSLSVLFILGFFVDILPLMFIGIPILYPVAIVLGINPIWFGVLVTLVINLGAFTPPVGLNLFVLKGMFKDIPIGVIYQGTMPFIISYVLAIVILFVAPSLTTWLPYALKG